MNRMIQLPLVAAMLVGGILTAQESTGTVLGTIRTAAGAVASGVRVQIAGDAILGSRATVTDNSGNFRFQILPPGDYTITISKDGFIGSRASFRVNPGQVFRQDLRLREIGAASDTVEIVASEAVQVDKTDTKTVTTMTANQLGELPVSLTSTSALDLAPGVTNAGDFPSFRGSPGGSSQFAVNGISVRDGFLRYGRQTGFIIQDLTDSIQVVQSPLNAKYGNTSGGVTNLVTKSGTNQFSGSFRATIGRPDWSNMRNRAPVYRRFNTTSPYTQPNTNMVLDRSTVGVDDLSRSYQLTLTGPVIKNHLTFSYGRYWSPIVQTTFSIPNLISSGNNYGYYTPYLQGATTNTAQPHYLYGATSPTDSLTYAVQGTEDVVDQFKLYWSINSSHQLEVYYTQNNLDSLDTQFGGMETDLGRRQKSDRRLLGVNYTGVILGGVLDAKWGRTTKEITWPTGPGEPIYFRTWRNTVTSIERRASGADGSASATTLVGGSPGSLTPELRQNDNYSLNYTWTNGVHNIDVGFERLKETGLVDVYAGPNNRIFYAPGINMNQDFAVYNWFLSPFAQTAYANANLSTYNTLIGSGNAYVPTMRVYNVQPDADYHTYDTSDAIYINNLWQINDNWSVMAGLRYDNWKIETYKGTELDTSDISPRFEVKYDINGDNKQLLTLSYAHLRGTIGFGNLGGYGRRPTDSQSIYFWNQGDEGNEVYFVPRGEILEPDNYKLFRHTDNSYAMYISPDVKPEVAKQIELSYRRSFETGGFVRASASYRAYDDNLYRRGTTDVERDPADTSLDPDNPAGKRLVSWLDIDPYNDRRYYGFELEWEVPIYRSAMSRVTANGNWTSGRSRGRVTWGDENATTAIRFDDLYATAGYNIDEYNAFGEYTGSRHNVFNMWVTWTYGRPGKTQSTLAVRGNYTTGAPGSLSFTEYLPGAVATETNPAILPNTSNTPTTLAYFHGNRGQFIGPDYYHVDLKWSLNIPVYKRLTFFTELTIGNIFNDVLISSHYRDTSTTIKNRASAAYNTNYVVQAAIGNLSQFGLPSGFTVFRTYGFNTGFRF